MRFNLKTFIAKLPVPFWISFYIFLVLLILPVLAYIGTFGDASPGSLTVTINQKSGTADPNPSYTSVFTTVFSEPIDEATFTDPDITLAGTATGQTVQSIPGAQYPDRKVVGRMPSPSISLSLSS